MIVTQRANCSITVARFDTKENITFDPGTSLDVDEATARYLRTLRCLDASGANAADFECPELDEILANEAQFVVQNSGGQISALVSNEPTSTKTTTKHPIIWIILGAALAVLSGVVTCLLLLK